MMQSEGDLSDSESSNGDLPPTGWDEDVPDYISPRTTFQRVFCCIPATEESNLENGGKIIMPVSALMQLAYMDIEYPMLFELKNASAGIVTHCGVQEFTADEGIIKMPEWMMKNMKLEEGNAVILKSTQVPRATYVKLQPHTKDFMDISNPKSILEFSLRNYSCLTTGDTIMIPYNNKKYYIDIVETKPSNAVSIIETDCEVDFAQPLDYIEPEPCASSDKGCPEVPDDSETKTAQFVPFTGLGRRLDGEPCTQSVEETCSMLKQLKTENETKNCNSKISNTASRRASGKLVFGSNANTPKIQTTPKASLKRTTQESSKEEEEPKFQAFTGKKYSLID